MKEVKLPDFIHCENEPKTGDSLHDQRQFIYCPKFLSLIELIPFDEIQIVYSMELPQKQYFYTSEKFNQAENLGLQVLSRINQDSHPSSDVDWLRGSFQKNSVKFSEVTYDTANGLFGCEFHFDLEMKNPLTADNDFWLDKGFC